MKKIKLTPIDEDFDAVFEDDMGAGEGLNFEFDLTPYVITCAMACGILFVTRFVQKHVFHKDLHKKYHF